MANAPTPKTPINIGALMTLIIFVIFATWLMIIVFHANDERFILFLFLLMCAAGAKLMIRQITPHHVTGVMNLITRKVEFLFSGINFVYLWQVPARNEDGSYKYTDLKEPIVCNCVKKFKAGDEIMMDVTFSITLYRDIYLDFETASQNMRKFISKDETWTKNEGEKLITQLLSSHFNSLTSEQLSSEIKVQKDLMNTPDYIDKIGSFQNERGLVLTLILQNSNPEKEAQDAFDVVAKAKAARKSYQELTKIIKAVEVGKEDELGMDPAEAQFFVKALFSNNSYDIRIRGLENLSHMELANILGGAPKAKTDNTKTKKGGK